MKTTAWHGVARLALALVMLAATPAGADSLSAPGGATVERGSVGSGTSYQSSSFLREARRYRAKERFELARQSYLKALSTCTDARDLEIIRNELAGVELLIRTMR